MTNKTTAEEVAEAKKEWYAIRLKNPAVGEYIDFNNFLNLYSRMKKQSQSRLNAIAKEVDDLYGDAMAHPNTAEAGYNKALDDILKIITKHTE